MHNIEKKINLNYFKIDFHRLLTKIPKYQASIDVMVFFSKKNKPKGKNSIVFSSIKRVYTSLNAIVFIF